MAPPVGMDLFSAGADRSAPHTLPAPAGAGFWIAGAALALAAFWFAGGHALATRWEAADEGSRLRVASLTSHVLKQGSRPLLLVDGTIENSGSNATPLPALAINVTDGRGRLTSHRLGRIQGRIAAHGSWRFSSRLEAPRSGVSAVTVTVDAEIPG